MSFQSKGIHVAVAEHIWYDYAGHTKDQNPVSFIEKGREK